MVVRVFAQNDIEGMFGEVTQGQRTKPPPRLLGPRFEALEYRDLVKHDYERAESWKVNRSRKSKYDATEGLNVENAAAFCSGEGDDWESAQAIKWRKGQLKQAVSASAGKQESARTHNTFYSNAKNLVAGTKRPADG